MRNLNTMERGANVPLFYFNIKKLCQNCVRTVNKAYE
jgi:hypothetical protein